MFHISSLEYNKEFSIYHYNLLATVSLPDFRAETSYVVNYFTRTVPDALKNYMEIDTTLFYEFVSSDVIPYSDKLVRNTRSLFNLLKIFSANCDLKVNGVYYKENEAYSLLSKKTPFVPPPLLPKGIYSTEIDQYINLTKIIQFVIGKFPSSIICFPFGHLTEVFFSYNSVRLLYAITNHNIHPKLLNFNKVLFFIFGPFILEEERKKVEEDVRKIEEEIRKEAFLMEEEFRTQNFTILGEEINELLLKTGEREVDFGIKKKTKEEINILMNDSSKMELIIGFIRKVVNYKYKLNNRPIWEILLPYKSTLLNLLMNVESKFVGKEIFNSINLFLKRGIPMFPKVKMECMACREKKKISYENEAFFKDTLVIQIIKECYFSNLVGEIEYTTCGCKAFLYSENLPEQFLWLEIEPEKRESVEEIEEERKKYCLKEFIYHDMAGEEIFKKCKITKSLLRIIKYYFYVSVHTEVSIIQYCTTHIILNILRSGNLWFVYELMVYIKKYLYEILFKCWCDILDGKSNAFEPFCVLIYKTINNLVTKWIKKENGKKGDPLWSKFFLEIKKLFSDWHNEDWVTLRLGYLNNLIRKESLTYFNKSQLDLWLEDVLTEPFMRYVSYFICEEVPEHDFLE